MKKFSKLFLLIFPILLLFFNLNAQSVLEKTLVKTIDPKGQMLVTFDNSYSVEVRQSQTAFLRLDIEITASHINENTFKSLISAGRYTIDTQIAENKLILKPSKLNKPIVINGQEWKEDKIKFILYVPDKIKLITDKSNL